MKENGDPIGNTITKRVNGIIKGEYMFNYRITILAHAKEVSKTVVKLYNDDHPHSCLNNHTRDSKHTNHVKNEIRESMGKLL